MPVSMRTHRAATGFTLIELLIAIAVIGVLASLLIPAAMMVQRSTRRAACMNNLRQIGMMTYAYCDDHDNAIPAYSRDYPTLFANGGRVCWNPREVFDPYMPEMGKRIYNCPAAAGKPLVLWEGDPNAVYGGGYRYDWSSNPAMSYGFNMMLMGKYPEWAWYQEGTSANINQIPNPSRVLWAADMFSRRLDYIFGPWFISAYRHGGSGNSWDPSHPGAAGFNALFIDGHAAWITNDVWYAFLINPAPENLSWL